MNNKPFIPDLSRHALVVTRVADGQWHVLAFDQLAEAMLATLPAPLHTLVDAADAESASRWQRAGFTVRRREWEFAVPTDPRITGLESASPPSGVRIVPAGSADEGLLRAVDQ